MSRPEIRPQPTHWDSRIGSETDTDIFCLFFFYFYFFPNTCASRAVAVQGSIVRRSVNVLLRTPQTPRSSAASRKRLSTQLLSLLKRQYSTHTAGMFLQTIKSNIDSRCYQLRVKVVLSGKRARWANTLPFINPMPRDAAEEKRSRLEEKRRRAGSRQRKGLKSQTCLRDSFLKNSKCEMENSSNRVQAQMGLVLFTSISRQVFSFSPHNVPCEVGPLSTGM